MRWFSSTYWDALVPTTAFFGQTIAVLVTFNDRRDGQRNGRELNYLPVFWLWR